MKRIAALLLFATLCAAASDIPKNPRELQYPPLNYQPPRAADYRHKLASGANAYLVEDHQLPLVNVSILVHTGKYLEPAGKTGLAALTGSQMRSGGTTSRPAAKYDEEAAFLAAQISSDIGEYEGQASVNCLSKDIDACLDLFVDMLRNPAFEEDRLKLAKAQLLQALQRRNDSTTDIESREFGRLLHGPEFFTTLPTTKASIDSITRADLAEFHARYYYPANFIIAVSGDFSAPEMISKLDKALGGWQSRSEKIPEVPSAWKYEPAPGVYLVDKKGVNQGRVSIGHIGTTLSNPDHIALAVMNGVLGGGGFSSRIMTRVRSDEGLAYSAGTRFVPGVFYPGIFQAYFQSKSMSVAQAVAINLEEIDRIRKEKVSAKEIDIIKASIQERLPQRFANANLKAAEFAADDFEKLPDDYWAKYRDRVKAVTADDVLRVARKYLNPDKLVVLVVGDADAILKGNPDKAQFQMEKFGKITRVPLPDPMTMIYPQQ